MEETGRSRRRFLARLMLWPALAWFFWYFTSSAKGSREILLEVDKGELPANGALVYRESRVAILHTAAGLHALSLVCPHLGCTVNLTLERFVCPCHGSSFDRQGQVLEGPAGRSLERLQIEDRGDRLVIVS